MQESQHGCLRHAFYMLQALMYVEEDHAKLRVSRLLDIASFPSDLLPVPYFTSSSYTHLSLSCLLCKKPGTVGDPRTWLCALDGYPPSVFSHFSLHLVMSRIIQWKNPSTLRAVKEQEFLLSLLMQEISQTAWTRTQVWPWKTDSIPRPIKVSVLCFTVALNGGQGFSF